jgi:prepilin-type N-terminal cleavage/methylation domain-containing protein
MGFSLIEVLVAMAIAAAVLSVTGGLLSLLAQQKARAITAAADVQEAMSFMRLVDRLLSDVGAGADTLVLDHDSLVVSSFGVPRGLAASAEVASKLTTHVAFMVDRLDGDASSAASRRTEAVLTDLERFEMAAEVDRRWVRALHGVAGSVTRIRFAWLRRGGQSRIHDVDIRRASATACIRNSLASGCSSLVP